MTKKKNPAGKVITGHKDDKNTKKKNPGGRPSKFGSVNPKAVKLLCERGFTDVEMKECLHVSEKTWNNWKAKNKEFYASLKDWKLVADREVERSLYERACGYEHPETKLNVVDGELIETELTRHYPPDTSSMIFWLKNRQPENWRDKTEVDNLHHISLEDFVDAVQKT